MFAVAVHHFKEKYTSLSEDKATLVKEYRSASGGLDIEVQQRPYQQIKPDDPFFGTQ